MKTFNQTKNTFDIYIDSKTGQFAEVEGVDAYSLIIASAIRNCRGEIQLDVERGVPYFETVFKSTNGIDIWKNDVRKRVLEFPFVKSIDSFEVSYANRKLEYTIRLTTDVGDVTITQ